MHQGFEAEAALRQGEELGIGQAIGQIAPTEAQQPLLVVKPEHRSTLNP
jgi:hypothetical protein